MSFASSLLHVFLYCQQALVNLLREKSTGSWRLSIENNPFFDSSRIRQYDLIRALYTFRLL